MDDNGRGVSLSILGIVAVIAIVGLVLMFTGITGQFVLPGFSKVYPGRVVSGETGQGFPYAGEGAYVAEQQGTCDKETEVFVQTPLDGLCRPGGVRVEIYQRNRKGFGSPDQTYTVKGYCCPKPSYSFPEGESY